MNILQKYEKYFYIILLIGIIIYLPIFFNGFVWDDVDYILRNPQVHQFNLSVLLGNNMFNNGPFYRPIPAIYFASMYSFFGPHAVPYHFFQLALHLINTSLLFLYFAFFFTDGIAFFLALVFLVHPINVESVAYIGSTQSELYFLPGITALLLGQRQHISRNKYIAIILLLFLSILTKETGFLFLLLFLAYRFIFRLRKLTTFFLSGIIMVVAYLLIRIFIGGVTYAMTGFVQIATLPFIQRLYFIPSLMVYYLKTFLFPLNLLVWQMWVIKTPTVENFVIPLFLSSIFFILLFGIFFSLYKKDQSKSVNVANQHKKNVKENVYIAKRSYQFLFFLLWYIVGMGLLLQLVPLDMTVADRWFYFPIVGLLGMIGVGLQFFIQKHNRKAFFYGAIILLSILSLRTFVRTVDWKDNMTLYSHDIQYENDNYILLNAYAGELYKRGKMDEYCYYESKSVNLYPTMSSLNELGDCYQKKGKYEDAIAAYKKSINLVKTYHFNSPAPYANLAYTLLLEQKPSEAVTFINNQAMKVFPHNTNLYTLLAIAYSQVGDHKNAVISINQSLQLSQDDSTRKVYFEIMHNIPITTSAEK